MYGLTKSCTTPHAAGEKPPHIHPSITEGATGGLPQAGCKLRYTGAQTMHFALHARAFLEPLVVHATCPSYKAWLALLDVVKLYLADTFTIASIEALDVAIVNFNKLYLKVPQFADRMRPKHHFLTHTSTDIINFGPPRNYWCFAYEAKNQVVKRAATASNFKDVIKTATNTLALKAAKSLLDRA